MLNSSMLPVTSSVVIIKYNWILPHKVISTLLRPHFMTIYFLLSKFQAYICQGDAFLAMAHYDLAEKSYSICLQVDPSLRRSKSFKVLIDF